MRIEVGPCPSTSVLAWTAQARAILDLIRTGAIDLPFKLPADVLVSYEASLEEWEEAAHEADPFSWTGDLDPATVRHLVQYWVNLVQYLVEHADGATIPLMPREGFAFRDVLIPAITSALAAEPDASNQHFGERTSGQWPGIQFADYPDRQVPEAD